MKNLLFTLMFLFGSLTVFGQSYNESQSVAPEQEKTLSPYFMVQNGDEATERFPLLETKAKVNIAGIIADVELTQVYKNDGKNTIEAVYVFPLGTKAAIHKMKMTIGERTIEAKIEERQAAKTIYAKAKAEGKVASLLEQERPNVFQMKVANIMPGDKVQVSLNYTELLVPEAGVYEFVYPTVVGPRYGGGTSEANDTDLWVANPYLHEGESAPYGFDITVNLATGIALDKVWVPTHKVDINYNGKDAALVQLSPQEKNGGNRDFILRYALQGQAIQTGLLLYPGQGENKENFFLLMAQPPKRISPQEMPAREYVFLVDVSGSMHGFPLEVSKSLITKLLNGLREKDYFNIMFFSGGSNALSNTPLAATAENKSRAIAMLSSQQGSGGTEILPALKKVLSLEKKEGLSRSVIIATDGYVAVEKQAFDIIREHLSEINVFAFGIGSSVNRFLIDGLARVGKGEPFVVTNQNEANKTAEKFLNYVSTPLLTDIVMKAEGLDVYDVEPISIPDLFAQRPLIVYGKYKHAKGRIVLQGRTGNGNYERVIPVTENLAKKENAALQYLWARERIARLADYGKMGENVKDEVTKLGLRYSLMTEFTSFVAVDTLVRNTGTSETVKQPLPLPEGVSDLAVGDYSLNVQYSANYCASVPSEGLYASHRAAKSVSGYLRADANDIGEQYSPELTPVEGASYKGFGGVNQTAVNRGDQLSEKSKEIKSLDKAQRPGVKSEELTKDGRSFNVTVVTLPAGTTEQEAQAALAKLKKQLKAFCETNELNALTVLVNIEKGKVTGITVTHYQGKNCLQAKLEAILKKLALPKSAIGSLEVEINF